MDHWLVSNAWALNSLFILECSECIRTRACLEWQVLIPLNRCVDHHALVDFTSIQEKKIFNKIPALTACSHGSPSIMSPGVHWETMFDCTDPANTIVDIDLSVVSECPDFQSTYANASLVNVQIIQRMSSTLVKTYICNLIVSCEVCHCK